MKKNMLLVLLSLVVSCRGVSAEIRVQDPGALKKILKAPEAGTVVIVADGLYDLGGTVVVTASGTAERPIIIRAEHRGKAEFVGDSRFRLDGISHIMIEGFVFSSTEGPAIELRGCQHVRISRNVFHLKESRRSSWVLIDGLSEDTTKLSGHHRVDHNLFEKKSVLGNFITIEGTMTAQPQVSQFDRIDRNHFRDIGPRVENALEAIRVGGAEFSLSSGFTVLEENLFERCDGDPEYISIKSSDDTIRANTFRECLGSLSLRHGNRNVVEGNYILGNGRTGAFLDSTGKHWRLGTGGLRFYGDDMRIVNNYLAGLTGNAWDAVFAITSGNAEYGDGQPLTKHFRIHRALIANNTMVDNAGGIEIGYDGGGFQGNWWPLPPEGMTITGNVISGTADTLIKIFKQPVRTTWSRNIVWPTGTAVAAKELPAGVKVADPKIEMKDGLASFGDPAIRGLGSSLPLLGRPLTPADVGPHAAEGPQAGLNKRGQER